MGILLICENCNWEIIPMLLVAWMLGLLFWNFFFRARHRKKIEELKTDLSQAKLQLEKNKRDIDANQYKNQKLTDEIVAETKMVKSLKGQLERLQKELDQK